MRENGTDRDVALSIVSALSTLAEKIVQLNDNLYVPHIITQPTDQTGAVDSNVTFTVVANNIAKYDWQYKSSPITTTWRDMHSGTTGADTDSITIPVTQTRYDYVYRCHMTGKDGTILNTENVKIIQPES